MCNMRCPWRQGAHFTHFLEAKEENAYRSDVRGAGKNLPKLSNAAPRWPNASIGAARFLHLLTKPIPEIYGALQADSICSQTL